MTSRITRVTELAAENDQAVPVAALVQAALIVAGAEWEHPTITDALGAATTGSPVVLVSPKAAPVTDYSAFTGRVLVGLVTNGSSGGPDPVTSGPDHAAVLLVCDDAEKALESMARHAMFLRVPFDVLN